MEFLLSISPINLMKNGRILRKVPTGYDSGQPHGQKCGGDGKTGLQILRGYCGDRGVRMEAVSHGHLGGRHTLIRS